MTSNLTDHNREVTVSRRLTEFRTPSAKRISSRRIGFILIEPGRYLSLSLLPRHGIAGSDEGRLSSQSSYYFPACFLSLLPSRLWKPYSQCLPDSKLAKKWRSWTFLRLAFGESPDSTIFLQEDHMKTKVLVLVVAFSMIISLGLYAGKVLKDFQRKQIEKVENALNQ
jgi:hypothetical protein